MGQKSSRANGNTNSDEKVASLIVRLRSSTSSAVTSRKRVYGSSNNPNARRYSSPNTIHRNNNVNVINDVATSTFYSPNYVCIRYNESLLIAFGYLRKCNINPTDIGTVIARYISRSYLTMSIQTFNNNIQSNYHLFRMIFINVCL